jgi:uncharacterized protein (UPF0210 family)
MKIRSLTYFDHPGDKVDDQFLNRCRRFQEGIQERLPELGFEVQTTRFASPPFPQYLNSLNTAQQVEYTLNLEGLLLELGYDYISLGPALPSYPESYQLVPDLLQSTSAVFCSGAMTDPELGVSLPAVKACGEIIHSLAPQDPNGFANLYFSALGNVPPGAPFFPAAYHTSTGNPGFAVAVEAADLAVKAFEDGSSFKDARSRLIQEIEQSAQKISRFAHKLERVIQAEFQGMDYSLAPFPKRPHSIGTALEELGVRKLGLHGSLAAAAFLADTIDRADFQRSGFSGLMLPVLEDAVLAERAAEGTLGLKDLLLYSAVCGTGLDTIPLPGDCGAEEISAVLMDLAVLSLRLDKPLTARLMPIPHKKAGDATNFDFPFFANSKVLPLEAEGLTGMFDGEGYLDILKRPE